MKFDWTWRLGRQGTGYQKLLVAQGSWWDCWLLKYAPGTMIPLHTDPVAGKRHYRLNVILKNASGGHFSACDPPLFRWGRIILFRPDINEHMVTEVYEGTRLVLSIGWVR